MYNIYNSIFVNNGEGIQDFKIFYDTLFLNIKVEDNTLYPNLLLIEPFKFDFSSHSFSSGGEGVVINFGNTGQSDPYLSNGNTLVDYVLDDSTKSVYIIGVSSSPTYTIPVIYSFDLNNKTLLKEFPSDADITDWANFTNYSYDTTQIPFVKNDVNSVVLGFKTLSADQYYLNLIELSLNKNNTRIKDYKLLKTPNLVFTGLNDKGLLYRMNEEYGIIDYK